MLVDINKFSRALNKITALVGQDKVIPGVLLDIRDSHIDVCYSDGRKALIEKIDAVVGDGDPKGRIVLDYHRLVEIIDASKASSRLYTDNLEIIFDNDKILTIKVEKKIPTQTDTSDIVYKTVSVAEQKMTWVQADANMKVAILSRMDYESIFNSDNPDEWEISVLRNILDKTAVEKGRIVYLTTKKKSAFVSNLAYMSVIPIKEGYNHSMALSSAVARSLHNILGILGNKDRIYIHVVDRFVFMYTDDKSVGLMVEMVGVNTTHLATLNIFQTKEFNNYQLTFIKDAIKNVVDSVLAIDKNEKTTLRFSKSEDFGIRLNITSSNGTASIKNEYYVECVEALDPQGNLTSFEASVSLSVLSDILDKCDGDYVAIDFDLDDTGTNRIRIGDIDLELREIVMKRVRDQLDLAPDDEIPLETKIGYRAEIISARYYTITVK